jgi:hypothetical protein
MDNTIIFAAGGGNDVFSAIAYIKSTNKRNVALISVLGLTPFHCLKDNDKIEPLHIIPTINMSRYIVKNPHKKIFCMESLIPEILSKQLPEITKYACISPKYSALEQADNLRNLFISWDMLSNNTKIEIVDFGGDILTDENQPSIISPELDAFTLAVVQNLKEYESKVIVCFPGVDGELSSEYLTNYCTNSIDSIMINNDLWLTSLYSIYEYIKKYRPGNTIPNMIKVLNKTDDLNLHKHWIINNKKIRFDKKLVINWELQSHLWIFNLNDVISKNTFTKVFNFIDYDLLILKDYIINIYNNQTKNNETVQSCDLFLQYLRSDSTGKYTNKELNYDDNEKILFVDYMPSCLNNND